MPNSSQSVVPVCSSPYNKKIPALAHHNLILDFLEARLELLHKVLPDRPHSCTLAENVHGYRAEKQDELNDADPYEHRSRAVLRQPTRHKQTEDQPVENILAEVECHQGLSGILPVTVHTKCDTRRRAKSAPEGNNSKEHRRHNQWLPS